MPKIVKGRRGLGVREAEAKQIFEFVSLKLRTNSSGSLYLSGMPGSGKTFSVYNVLNEAKRRNLPSFKLIEVNGLKIKEPREVYVKIWQEITGEHASPYKAAELLDSYFSASKKRGKCRGNIVILADEIDMLYTPRKQSILYNLFDWPSRPNSRLIVLAIANAMDLPERIMNNRVISRVGLSRLTFKPYDFQELETIISSRMKDLNVFQPEAITLASRRVAAVTGDARKAINLSRRAAELAREKKKTIVGMVDVNDAIQEMFSSPLILAVKNSSLNQKLLIRAILANFQSTGTDVTTLNEVYGTLLRIQGII
jgi:origin recognition complex subunit 1